jgi:2-keto-4-pentenoate hydratase/2-oxohepta-3-ene-1,7-dioic acid hydratase in catechol pathway
MRLGSAFHAGAPLLVGSIGDELFDLSTGFDRPRDVSELLAGHDGLESAAQWLASRERRAVSKEELSWRPLTPHPGKVVALGLNYADHAAESPYDRPDYPVLFPRFTTSLLGHRQPLVRPTVSDQFDYEGELVAVIGRRARSVPVGEALRHVAGYSIFNDGSVRDYQFKSHQWTVGKNFDGTGPLGPLLVTSDELPPGAAGLRLTTRIDDRLLQEGDTADMLFGVAETISTPAGIGFARDPQVFLRPGDTVTVSIEGIGELVNGVVDAGEHPDHNRLLKGEARL